MEIVYLSLLTIIASGVGTLTGFGTSTILVPSLLLFYPLPLTLLLVGIIHWFGDIWKITLFREGINPRLILTFGIPGIITTYIGARLVFGIPETILVRILGAFLLLYAIFLFAKPKFELPKSNSTSIAGGSLYGFSAGIFGVGGAIRGAFLAAFNLPKKVYIATVGVIGLIIDSVRVTTYFIEGSRLSEPLLWGLIFFIPASFLGAKIAQKIVHRIPEKKFRKVVLAFLFLVAIVMLLRGG